MTGDPRTLIQEISPSVMSELARLPFFGGEVNVPTESSYETLIRKVVLVSGGTECRRTLRVLPTRVRLYLPQ